MAEPIVLLLLLLVLFIVVLGPGLFVGGLVFMLNGYRFRGGLVTLLGATTMGLVYWAYSAIGDMNFSKGRVLRLKGRARVARRALGDGWADDAAPALEGLTPWQRTVLGEAWMYSASLEHASVPAFAKLSLKLSSLGAPSELLEACHLAALDEVRHARRCFAFARAYSGLPWSAGTIPELGQERPLPSNPGEADDWSRLVRGSLLDGCLGEGLAASVAGEAARRASDPVVRETLAVIAEDEGRHAELAWDVIAFALERGGGKAKQALRQALEALEAQQTPALPRIPGVDEAFLARNGVLPQAELGRLMEECLQRTRVRASAWVEPSAALPPAPLPGGLRRGP
ncbi:ferritin-like domain-containing protein [Corallococcus praedator]|uniref:Ferritin-like domain-containing protein n=1 Tax=Corallococcus praedator TaxID=2316724 RepID=A0ABX9Q8T1_9BACT|nr:MULTISPECIES: ferritin-like domain-containing protein [Corallococcus]RKH16398.1 ferritin-like domain-containing protein [Corallococcus sp. CA047B]RKH34569.1 ferritin-like domain-containing protein [Corallococcus sp. CA031C]RKH92654.1 ferritin-like domain-containing protein [Corallococcus praedator]